MIIDAWGGCSQVDVKRNRFYCAGGGHNDYHGNDVWYFDLSTMKWANLTAPSDVSCVTPSGTRTVGATGIECQTLDGSWLSAHSYSGVNYVESLDALVVLGGAFNNAPGGFTAKNGRPSHRRRPLPSLSIAV